MIRIQSYPQCGPRDSLGCIYTVREGDTKPQPKTAIITYSFLPPGFILGHVLAHVEKDEMRNNIPTRDRRDACVGREVV